MQTVNLNETLNYREKQVILDTLTPLRIDQLVQYMESKPLGIAKDVLFDIGTLNGNYYLLKNVHEELAHYYKNEVNNELY